MNVDALARPRFKSSIRPVIGPESGLFLLAEGGNVWMPDPVYAALAPLLDGTHEVETIFATLSRNYPVERVFAALDRLRTNGYLAEDTSPEARPALAFWENLGVAPSLARSRLRATRVSSLALGDIDVAPLQDLLADHGGVVAAEGDVTVVAVDDYLHPQLTAWNSRSLASRHPWLLVKPVGIEIWIGPMFVPGETACWECLAQRLRGHRKLEHYLARCGGIDPPGAFPAGIASTRHAALAEAATEITRWIGTGGQSNLRDRVVSTNVLTLERTHHALVPRPQCPACGSPQPDNPARVRPVNLHMRPKVHRLDGGHRAARAERVLERLQRHVSPITGIVSTLIPAERAGRAQGADEWLTPLFAADHNFSDMHEDRFFLREGMRCRSGGKGKSVEQARISALAESVERYCGVFDGTEPRIRASFAELGKTAIHPNACMLYSERQYAERQAHNARGHKAHWVPEPFREDAAIEWTGLWSLAAEQTRYLPTALCYYGYPDAQFGRGDSNGCAAGSVMEEAVLQGFLELVERDAVALWWYNRLRRRGVDLGSAGDPYVAEIVEHYRGLRRDVWLLDVTGDFGIPTFAALSRRVDKPEEDIIYGFGAHLDAEIALTRALTEMNQTLEAVPAAVGPPSTQTYRGGEDSVRWWRTVRAAEAPYLLPDPNAGLLRLDDLPNLASDDLYQDVLTCVELAAGRGIEVLVLDQTRPDIGFPVVRVVAPGLRHFWARFGRGRLYDVPVREGWLDRALDESELNPFVIQF